VGLVQLPSHCDLHLYLDVAFNLHQGASTEEIQANVAGAENKNLLVEVRGGQKGLGGLSAQGWWHESSNSNSSTAQSAAAAAN
jgi:hypothetical protein